MQVPLSGDDDGTCVGGHLAYAGADGTLLLPRRVAGAIIAHDGDVVHGVTRLDAGTRYGLYALRARK